MSENLNYLLHNIYVKIAHIYNMHMKTISNFELRDKKVLRCEKN